MREREATVKRRNGDEELRRLEREARGDPSQLEALAHAKKRFLRRFGLLPQRP